VYFGVGNGTPWNQVYRDPKRGDNLFLASIVAVNAMNSPTRPGMALRAV
jgi:quinohemoprotein ethanol dehydrogenase